MSLDSWLFVGLIACMAALALVSRHRVVVQRILGPFLYLVMYRSQVGVAGMRSLAERYGRFIHAVTPFIIGVGFVGMAVVSVEVVLGMYNLLINPQAAGGVGLVLPVKAKGIFYVPFLYWILSIFVVVVAHEASHGIVALANKVRIKSSGLACLAIGVPLIPAAFVEPDETVLEKRGSRVQLGVFAAGPFANIVLGMMFLAVFAWASNPVVDGFYEKTGVTVTKFAEGDVPIRASGFPEGGIITSVNGKDSKSLEAFHEALKGKKPGDFLTISTGVPTTTTSFTIILSENKDQPGKPYMGVFVEQAKLQVVHSWWVPVVEWLNLAVLWLFAMNVGVGLFNLLPLGIVDGGRMLHVVLHRVLARPHAMRAWVAVSGVFFAIVVGSVVLGIWRA